MSPTIDNIETIQDGDISSLGGAMIALPGPVDELAFRLHAAEEALARERNRFAALVRTQKEVASGDQDLERVIGLIAGLAVELTSADGAAVKVRTRDAMVYRAACGTAEGLIGHEVPLTDPLLTDAVASGRILYYADYQAERRGQADTLRHARARSLLAAPLRGDSGIVGLLVLTWGLPGAFPPHDMPVIELIVGIIAMHVNRFAEAEAKQALLAERTSSLARLEEVQALNESSIKSMHEGYLLQHASGKILMCNDSACKILRIACEDYIGQECLRPEWRIIHEDGSDFPREDHPSQVALRTGKPQSGTIMGFQWDDGVLKWLSVNASPVFHQGYETPYAIVSTFTDITAIKQQEEALRRSEARLAEAQRIAGIGSWELDLRTNTIFWSDEMYRLYEFDPAMGLPDGAAMLARVHPDDLAERNRVFGEAIATGKPYQFTLRLVLPSGLTRICHAVGVPEVDSSGVVTRIAGTIMDVTERTLSEERFRILFEESSDAHLLLGEEGMIDCNNAMLELMHCPDKAAMLAGHPATLAPEYQPDGQRSRDKAVEMDRLARENGFHRFEWLHRNLDGEDFPVEVTLTPVTLGGKPVILAVLHDLTERVRAEQQVKDYAIALEFQMLQLEAVNAELAALATTDGLTGLKNHRTFQERLVEEVARATRYKSSLSVLMLDVDHFKQFNDAFGHPAGDEVLREVAQILSANARETDTAARYGGEEFAIILPETDYDGASHIAERIRKSIEDADWPRRPVTASVGAATMRPGITNSGRLLSLADAALYTSKAEGRNRVTAI